MSERKCAYMCVWMYMCVCESEGRRGVAKIGKNLLTFMNFTLSRILFI